jgi:UrcA family protein
MKKTFFLYGATFLALVAAGLAIRSGPAIAQQGDEAMEEVVVVEVPLEGREVGRSNIGVKIEEFELKRRVSYADLNLCNDADVTEMQTRIENTANELCKELSDKLPSNRSDPAEIGHCTKKASDGAQEQLQTAVATAKSDSDGDGVANCMD